MKINFLSIHDYDLNISKRLNECINLLPNEWICLSDNDVLKFPNFANNLKECLESADKNNLYGTMTNRLRPTNPQVVKKLFDEPDINKHFQASIDFWNHYSTELQQTNLIAGSCMIFHKDLFNKIGGFQEDKTFFDKYFSYDVINNGGKCLIFKGIYTFHLYRWDSKSPVDSVQHLIKN